MSQTLSSAAVVIGTLRVKIIRYTVVPAKSDSHVLFCLQLLRKNNVNTPLGPTLINS